jgi:hypothetical protein
MCLIPGEKSRAQHQFDEFEANKPGIVESVKQLVNRIKKLDDAWHKSFSPNMIFNSRAEAFHTFCHKLNFESLVIIIKNDAAINIYVSHRYFDANPKRESYFDVVGVMQKMLRQVHDTSYASSYQSSAASTGTASGESSGESSGDSSQNQDLIVENFGGGNKKTRKYLKKTNSKKSRKQRKSKKHVLKSNRKTKRK